MKYQRLVGQDHVIGFGTHAWQLPANNGQCGYAGAVVELSHQLNGELVVWRGQQRLYAMPLPLDYTPGQAPRRPRAGKRRQAKIYVLGGRPAIAVRP